MKAQISTCTYCHLRISRVLGVWLALDGGASGICALNPRGAQHHPQD
jgi:hypothetical protein